MAHNSHIKSHRMCKTCHSLIIRNHIIIMVGVHVRVNDSCKYVYKNSKYCKLYSHNTKGLSNGVTAVLHKAINMKLVILEDSELMVK